MLSGEWGPRIGSRREGTSLCGRMIEPGDVRKVYSQFETEGVNIRVVPRVEWVSSVSSEVPPSVRGGSGDRGRGSERDRGTSPEGHRGVCVTHTGTGSRERE